MGNLMEMIENLTMEGIECKIRCVGCDEPTDNTYFGKAICPECMEYIWNEKEVD